MEFKIFSFKQKNNKEKKMSAAELVIDDLRKIIQDMIDLEQRSTLQQTFHRIAMKAGVEVNQIKRIYYNECKYVYAHVWLKLVNAHKKAIDNVLDNVRHKQMLAEKKMAEFDVDIENSRKQLNELLKKNN